MQNIVLKSSRHKRICVPKPPACCRHGKRGNKFHRQRHCGFVKLRAREGKSQLQDAKSCHLPTSSMLDTSSSFGTDLLQKSGQKIKDTSIRRNRSEKRLNHHVRFLAVSSSQHCSFQGSKRCLGLGLLGVQQIIHSFDLA